MAKQKIILMNKNTPILEFMGGIRIYEDNERGPKGMPYFDASDFKYLNKELCPLTLKHEESQQSTIKVAFDEWFRKRGISKQRMDVIPLKIDWSGEPTFFSMTDQYWFKSNDLQSWDSLNFFTNEGNPTLGNISFSKNLKSIISLTADYHSPDLTTNGVAKKKWIQERIEGAPVLKNYLLKSTRQDFSQGIISEILASKFLIQLRKLSSDIPEFVPYTLDINGYELCSKCKNFLYPNVEFVPAKEVYASVPIINNRTETYDHLMDAIEYYKIPGGKEFVDWMIIIDRYLLNYDRHLGNFGFLRDVETGEFKGPAPLFDFGNAFFTDSEKYKSKMMAKREDELFDASKILPIDKELLNEMKLAISDCGLLGNLSKNNIYLNICKNNDIIKARYVSDALEKNKDLKGKNVQSIDFNFAGY